MTLFGDDHSRRQGALPETLFAFLIRNAAQTIGLFNIPTDFTIEFTLQAKLRVRLFSALLAVRSANARKLLA